MVITRVLKEICKGKNAFHEDTPSSCKTFHTLPVDACYSIKGSEYKKFFDERYLNETMGRLRSSVIAHVWNKFSAETPLSIDANVAYIHLAKRYCPRVVKASKFF